MVHMLAAFNSWTLETVNKVPHLRPKIFYFCCIPRTKSKERNLMTSSDIVSGSEAGQIVSTLQHNSLLKK